PVKKPRAPVPPFVEDIEERMTAVPLVFDDTCEYCLVPSSTLCSAFSKTETCQVAKSDPLSRSCGYSNADTIVVLSDAATKDELIGSWAASTLTDGGQHYA
ncbi:hypothetical protein GGI19_000775, partial [Coemansia pectinata]